MLTSTSAIITEAATEWAGIFALAWNVGLLGFIRWAILTSNGQKMWRDACSVSSSGPVNVLDWEEWKRLFDPKSLR